MKKTLTIAFLSLFIAGSIFSACSSDSDESTTVASRDCIISAAALGTIPRTIHAIAKSGKDTTYSVNVTGSYYPLYIDQINYTVYNPDSLPVGTRSDKVVLNTFTCSSTATIKSLTSGRDTTFTYSDSTDFSQKRTLTVWAADGVSKRDYTFDIRVHKEEADSFPWQLVASSSSNAVAAFIESRTLVKDGALYVFGKTPAGLSQLVRTSVSAPSFADAAEVKAADGTALDVRSVQCFNGVFYALANGAVVSSETGQGDWNSVAAARTFDALVAVSTDSIYALGDGKLYASADAVNWAESSADEPDLLPTSEVCAALQTSRVDDTYRQIVMAGHRDGEAVVWKLDIDTRHDFVYPWINIPQTAELGDYPFPLIRQNTLVPYGDVTLLVGLESDGTLAPFYTSSDNGRTWIPGEYKHPAVTGLTAVSAAVDADNYLWLVCSGSGTVYKGRLNKLGWKTVPTKFN